MRLEFEDDIKKYQEIQGQSNDNRDKLDFESVQFKAVCERLNPSAIANLSSMIVKGMPYPIMDMDLGDQMLNNAAKALSLLYVQDLQDLRTRINEAIVIVQSVTTNPKTNTKLGQVGMCLAFIIFFLTATSQSPTGLKREYSSESL